MFNEINTLTAKEGMAVPIKMPAIEVNVTVNVKLKGMAEPIAFSRNYLPELETITREQMGQIAKDIKNKNFNNMNGHNDLSSKESIRISEVYEHLMKY